MKLRVILFNGGIMRKCIIFILAGAFCLFAETLFEVKDASNNTVFKISEDGLRVFNLGDTLMVISADAIRANISSSKGLSRTFSVTTNSAKGSGLDLMRLTSDSTRFWISDSGSGFGVSSLTSAKEKSVATDFLKVSNINTQMREGSSGERYTDFSPENIFLGLNAGINNIVDGMSGSGNVFVGNSAGEKNMFGGADVFIGHLAGYENVAGITNIFIGKESGYNNIEGHSNIYIGHRSGYTNPYGNNNVCIGPFSGLYMPSGENNVFLGANTGRNAAGSGNVFLGYYAGTDETGSDKLYIENSNSASPLIYGEFDNDLVKINGDLHVVGSPTLGSLMIAPSEATNGDDAEIILAEDIDGTFNMSMKYDGGLNRLEWWAEDDAGTYGPLMYLGYNTLGGGIPHFYTGFLKPMSDNIYDLGASSLRWDDVFATNGVIQTSDKRQKSEIKDMDYGLSTVMKMRPVSYYWKDKPERGRKVGLIAQELINIIPEIVNVGEDENKTLGINYAELTPVLVKAIQDQQKEIEKLRESNVGLSKELSELSKELSEIKKILNDE